MVRLGGAASPTYVSVFRGLQAHFLQHGIELDWVIYSDYDALVEAPGCPPDYGLGPVVRPRLMSPTKVLLIGLSTKAG